MSEINSFRENDEMKFGPKIGLELEFILSDEDGKIVNRADEVLNDQLNPGTLVRESSYGVVEGITAPSSSLIELETSFKNELAILQDITYKLGLKATPISEVGPEDALEARTDSPRYITNTSIVGKARNSLCGTHIHLDHKKDKAGQYNLLQSLDPVFVFLSNSSFLRGGNTLNCNRVNMYRNHIFKDMPLHGQLVNYVLNIDELEQQNEQRLNYWLKQIDFDEEAQSSYDRYSTCWGPIRIREKTTESRNSDANVLSLVMAKAALYKGMNEYAFRKGLEIKISEQDNKYGITGSEIILPSYSTLKAMEKEGSRDALRSELVHQYLSYLVNIAEDGLPDEERRYLKPFKEMLEKRRNIADVIYDFAKKTDPSVNGKISAETAHKVNMFMNDLYHKDLVDSTNTLNVIKNRLN